MSNPWASSYDALRAPYLQEKKAKKDYDGDGKVESGSKEHAGVVHNAIQKAKGGKPDGKDTRKEEVVSEKDGLWDNIHQKRKRMKSGSGEKKAKPGDKDYPKTLNVEAMSSYDKARKAAARRAADRNAKRRRGEMGGNMERETYTNEAGTRMHHKGYRAEDLQVNHIDGSKTEIYDIIKAPKMPDAREMMEGKMKQARKNVGADTCWDGYKAKGTKMKGGKVVPNCEKEEVEVNEMDGSKLGIGLATGVIGGGLTLMKKAAETANSLKKKMQQRTKVEQYSNWREDFIWEGPATAKDPKLDVKETGVKNKIEVNPEVKTEEKKKSSSYSSTI